LFPQENQQCLISSAPMRLHHSDRDKRIYRESPMKVFVAENSSVIRERLREMLNSIPCVELAGETDNEAGAVQSICTIQPDVVILGFSSARENLDVLRGIRLQALTIKVIVMTNKVYSLYRSKCINSGADYFLDKSRDIGKLSSLLSCLADETTPENGLVAMRENE
jgi:DNA-binding NarL/FixJ family response regulator